MRAILLAAGRGERLRPLTDDRPKCLVELGGTSLLDHQLATLKAAGIDDIVVVTGYRAEAIRVPGVRFAHNADWQTTNMVETLFCAQSLFAEDMIIAYADIVYEPRVLSALLDNPYDAGIVVDRDWRSYWEQRFADPLSDAESLRLDPDHRILDIGQPIRSMDEPDGQYIGLMRFRRAAVSQLKAAKARFSTVERPWMTVRPVERAYMTDLIMEMIEAGADMRAVPVNGGWLEIDDVDDFELAKRILANRSIRKEFNATATTERTDA